MSARAAAMGACEALSPVDSDAPPSSVGSPLHRPVRPFTRDELAFFLEPRTWPAILERFGVRASTSPAHEALRDRIMHADCDGGDGFLDWDRVDRTWTLTADGVEAVQDPSRLLAPASAERRAARACELTAFGLALLERLASCAGRARLPAPIASVAEEVLSPIEVDTSPLASEALAVEVAPTAPPVATVLDAAPETEPAPSTPLVDFRHSRKGRVAAAGAACRCCSHWARPRLDADAVAAGDDPLELLRLAEVYGVSERALERHVRLHIGGEHERAPEARSGTRLRAAEPLRHDDQFGRRVVR